jgi:hypothetical protein
MDMNLIAVVAVIVLLLAVAALLLARRRRSEKLAERFGPEYDRAVHDLGSRDKAEAELAARQKRVDKLHLVPLTPADAEHFTQAWKALQSRFIDSPQGSLMEADLLVRELMQKRGYPMGDFDSRAADISVHYPTVVEHYRAAHAIAVRDQGGQADTEQLRQAVVHYRALFAELLEVQAPQSARERQPWPRRPETRRELPRGEHAMARPEPVRDPVRDEPGRNEHKELKR